MQDRDILIQTLHATLRELSLSAQNVKLGDVVGASEALCVIETKIFNARLVINKIRSSIPDRSNIRLVATHEEQLQLWVAGESVHVRSSGDEGYECCPDFSCCEPDMLVPVEIRKAFQVASTEARQKYLMTFLSDIITTKTNTRVHITDGSHENRD